jgi:hypothetical protein
MFYYLPICCSAARIFVGRTILYVMTATDNPVRPTFGCGQWLRRLTASRGGVRVATRFASENAPPAGG